MADDPTAPSLKLVRPVYTRACYRGTHTACPVAARCDCGCHGDEWKKD